MKLNYQIQLMVLIFGFSINSYSQKNKNRFTVDTHQNDARFTFAIEKYWSNLGNSEEYYFNVKNNTSEEFELEIEVNLTLNCVITKPCKLGSSRKVYLKPNGEFTSKDDYSHVYMISSGKNKSCLIPEHDTFTLYKEHTWQINSVVNITQKKAEEKRLENVEAEKKAEEEKIRKEEEEKRKRDIELEKWYQLKPEIFKITLVEFKNMILNLNQN